MLAVMSIHTMRRKSLLHIRAEETRREAVRHAWL
jgi:hypothetical protein